MFLCMSASFDFGCFVVLMVSFCKRVVPQLLLGIARYINLIVIIVIITILLLDTWIE